MNSIELKGVSKTIKGKVILSDINLSLSKGGIYGFFGRNGSGKTMLFRVISGLLVPDSGSVTVFGQLISEKHIFPQGMGLVIEHIGLWRSMTGMENLMLLAGIKAVVKEDEVRFTMARLGLDPDDKRKYGAYSMGMKQKLALAQAVMEEPDLLILDEPTNSLDEESIELFRLVIQEEKARGATCLIATHQKEDIDYLCDRVFLVKNGTCNEIKGEDR